MKKILLLTLFAQIAGSAFAQTPPWAWAKSAGGTGADYAESIAVDASGNTYMAGSFYSLGLSFGSNTLTNNSSGTADIFLAKYSPNGNVLWAKEAGGMDEDVAYSVAVDDSGNTYVAGFFYSSSITFDSTTLFNSGMSSYDMFLVKYNANGNVLWAKVDGGTGDDYAKAVTVDVWGQFYVSGSFGSPSIMFDSTTLTNTNTGTDDIFLVKYAPDGNVLWAKAAGGTNPDFAYSVSVDTSGNIYIAGSFKSSTISFDSTPLFNIGAGSNDVFLTKYAPNGNVLWAKAAGGTGEDEAYSVAVDASGNTFLAGTFVSSSITFDSTTLTSSGSYEIFLAKYDSNGNILWAKGAVGGNTDVAKSVSVDASGNIFLAGYFLSTTLTFGSNTLSNNNSVGYPDIYVAKFASDGNILWAKATGGNGYDYAFSASVDASGNIYVAGFFRNFSITFGSTTLMNANPGYEDLFLAKLEGTTGINDRRDEEVFSIYPNPFSTQITLQTENPFNSATLTLYNSLGQQVNELKKISGQTISFRRENLISGQYYLRLTEDNRKTETFKITITD